MNVMPQHIDEFMEEHLAAKAEQEADREALKAAQEAGRWLRQCEQAELARAVREAVRKPIWIALQNMVNNTTPKHTAVYTDGKLFIDGVDVSWVVDFKETYTHISRWRSKPSGKINLVVGNYGERTNYPPRKDGSYNYEAIAQKLVNYAARQNAGAKADAQRQANKDAFIALRDRLGLKEYTSFIKPSTVEGKPVTVEFQIKHAMTEEQTIKVYEFLKTLGIAPTY